MHQKHILARHTALPQTESPALRSTKDKLAAT